MHKLWFLIISHLGRLGLCTNMFLSVEWLLKWSEIMNKSCLNFLIVSQFISILIYFCGNYEMEHIALANVTPYSVCLLIQFLNAFFRSTTFLNFTFL